MRVNAGAGRSRNSYPIAFAKHHPSEAVSTCCDERRWAANKTLIHDRDLEEVLRKRPGLEIVVICFAYPPQEAHRPWPAKLKLQHGEHETLGLENLVCGIASVHHKCNLVD